MSRWPYIPVESATTDTTIEKSAGSLLVAQVPSRGSIMANQSNPMRAPWGDIAPRLTEISDAVLFDDVWKRPELSPRDRSLVTVAALIALYRTNEQPFHLEKAIENGVTRDEIIEVITHLAFYSGWPTASTALGIARRVLTKTP